jgi:WD40 repeat protein/serine/threonine protein kinase
MKPAPASQDLAVESLMTQVADEFIERLHQGEQPQIEDYAQRYPEIAAFIRQMFPALQLLRGPAPDPTPAHAPEAAAPAAGYLGDYRILREVGRGGMGIVYEAEQVSLRRRVALKVLPFAATLDPKRLQRFQHEAQAAAQFHHTNIVPVYAVGCERGVHFYAMQYIEGQTLAGFIRELRQQAPRRGPSGREESARRQGPEPPTGPYEALSADAEVLATASTEPLAALSTQEGSQTAGFFRTVARLGIQAAEALAHAHQLGVVHRDIKPANLLVDGRGNLWITDFGLAHCQGNPNLTLTGDLVGTVRYMSPEQVLAKRVTVDERTDVYSLGVTLYELVTLEPACPGRDREEVLRQLAWEEPRPPRRLNPSVPTDLETIVLKAMEKNPEARYATAQELADDLKHWLAGEPIRARRVGNVERLWRWCRRNPAVGGLLATVAVLLVGITVGSLIAAVWYGRLAWDAEHARQNEAAAHKDAELTLADMYTSFGLAAGARDDPRQAVLWFAHAAQQAGDDRERADANRIRAAAWGRLAIQPVRAFVHPAPEVENNMAVHPDGRHLLTHGFHLATGETDCRLWDLEQEVALPFPGNPGVVSATAWDGTGERLAVGTPQGEVTIYRFPEGVPLQRVPFTGRIAHVLFSADGRYCALAAANRARVWDCRQAAFATPELKHPAAVATLAFHPRGELLATGCRDYCCRVFAVPAEQNTPLFTPVPHVWWKRRGLGYTPVPPLFLDEGRGLLTLGQGEASWRDPGTGQVLRVLPLFGETGAEKYMTAIALSGDGKHVVLADNGFFPACNAHARIFDVASAQPVSPNVEHRVMQPILSAAFSPDGQTLLTGSGDRTLRRWTVPGGKPLGDPLTHPTIVSSVAFARDGRHLATAQVGGLIRLWSLPACNPRDYRAPVGAQSFVRLSRDGRFLLPTGLNRITCALRSTRVFELTTGQRVGPPLEANGFIMDAAFSPDGLQVAAAISRAASPQERFHQPGRQPGQLLLWDWRAGKLQHGPLPLPSEPRKLDYSPDGRQLAVVGAKGDLVVIDPATGKTLRQWQAHPPYPENTIYINNGAVRFSADNRLLLTFGATTNSVRVWDALTGQLRQELKHQKRCHDVQFSADGRLVATAGYDSQVCVWELATGEQLARLAHPDSTYTAHFSPDGQHLLTACRDNMARLWDWRAGRLVCPAFEHEHEVHVVAFTPDGRHVLSGSDDGVLKIWEWCTGKPVCPPFALGDAILSLAVAPDGRWVAVGGFMKELAVIHLDDWLAPVALEPDDLCLWGEILSGQRIEAGGGVTNLTAEEWLERWRQFRVGHPATATDRKATDLLREVETVLAGP